MLRTGKNVSTAHHLTYSAKPTPVTNTAICQLQLTELCQCNRPLLHNLAARNRIPLQAINQTRNPCPINLPHHTTCITSPAQPPVTPGAVSLPRKGPHGDVRQLSQRAVMMREG